MSELSLVRVSRGSDTGGNNSAVQDVQEVLNDLYHCTPPLVVDGNFGPLTEAAVKIFQRANGLKADGVVGAETAAMLDNDDAVTPREWGGDPSIAVPKAKKSNAKLIGAGVGVAVGLTVAGVAAKKKSKAGIAAGLGLSALSVAAGFFL